ncbi:MAG: peroxisome biogenesis factor 10 [Vezdaea aestivalis]|nr:MAG: peroxisome biogenesis factor 10 [Vezdaea aestivalis]
MATDYQYPYATSPDIVRSYQRDASAHGTLASQITNLLRHIYGARFVHIYANETRTAAELLYFGLTTFLGSRTLGEEYCDLVHVETTTNRLPSLRRRTGYIVTSILGPYLAIKHLPKIRARIRRLLSSSNALKPSAFKSYLLDHLDTITSPSPVHYLTLTLFYFGGAYYHLSKRLLGLRYIFTRHLSASEQREGYEVLGALLLLQLAAQGWMQLQKLLTTSSRLGETERDAKSGGLTKVTSFPQSQSPNYDLKYWIFGSQQRKCTLCLDDMTNPSTTPCGHVFCWVCIGDWCREKAECPLCRQSSLPQHILPLKS